MMLMPMTGAKPEGADIRPQLLVVDDEPDMLFLMRNHLVGAGCDVTTAVDGADAVEKARQHPYDLILSDLSMPRMDGWAMLKTLKADHRTREVPVILFSAHDDYRESLRKARAGAHDYLAKTGRGDQMVSAALKVIAPRLETAEALRAGEQVEVRIDLIGLQWLLRALNRLRCTGVLALQDYWGKYQMSVHEGRPVWVQAGVWQHNVTGLPALAPMMMAVKARGAFTFTPLPEVGPFAFTMEELIQRVCEHLNAAESKSAQEKLASPTSLDLDPKLYELFCRIAPARKVVFAQAMFERQMPMDEVAASLKIPSEQCAGWLEELLLRGVITPRNSSIPPVPPDRALAQERPAPSLARDVYPYVMGGLLHDALNVAVPLQHFSHQAPGDMAGQSDLASARMRLGLDRLVRVLQLMQDISRANYLTGNREHEQEEVQKIVDEYRGAHPEIAYSLSQRAPMSLPAGITTFLVGELLENATRACSGVRSPRVELSFDFEDDGTRSVVCADTGRGFPEPLLDRVRSGHIPRPGSAMLGGHGLYLMKEIVERLSGQLLCANREEGGARVQLLLPREQERGR